MPVPKRQRCHIPGMVPALLAAAMASWLAGPAFAGLGLATFDVDVTPPVGSRMTYDRVVRVDELGLRCRGVVLIGAGQPIVLCAFDWIGIGNESQDVFRGALAEAAGTVPDRVVVHAVHQHDAPTCDFTSERLLKEAGAKEFGRYEGAFAREVVGRLSAAVRGAVGGALPVTHCGWGEAEVGEVASNRRILGPDGRVRVTRYTTCKDAAVRAEPEGVIDPRVSLLAFWNGKRPLAVLSYYACHPQSYYRTGVPSPDFPGIARLVRGQAVPEALHVHFNGAGGNVGAGKYNDGAKENRMALALRLADGMRRAWEGARKFEIDERGVGWSVEPAALPPAAHLDEAALRAEMAKASEPEAQLAAADKLAWLLRCREGKRIPISMLSVGDARVLHLPGELFVEYQLAAKAMRPDLGVAMAAYGDYGPGYICTARAYEEGGYEASERASDVSPEVEGVLMAAMRKLLGERSAR